MNIIAATVPDGAKDKVYNVAVGDRTTLNDLFGEIKGTLSQQPRSKLSRNLEPALQEGVCLDSQKTKSYAVRCGELNP